MTDTAKKQKKTARRIAALVTALLLTFVIKDAVCVFADAMLPVKTVTLRIVPCSDSSVRELTIICENKDNEIFRLLQEHISNDGTEGVLQGWRYTEGEQGVSWTRIQAAEAGDEIDFSVTADPDYYFTVLSNRWSGAFEMSIDGGEPLYIDCYQDKSSSDILKIRPYENDQTQRIIRGIFYLLAAGILFVLISVVSSSLSSNSAKESLYPILVIVFCVAFFSMYYLLLNQARGYYRSDLPTHIQSAVASGGYSLNHLFLKASYRMLGYYGCALYLTITTSGTMILAGCFLRVLQKEASAVLTARSSAILIGIAVCYMGSIYLPNVYPLFYLYHDYTGLGTASSIGTQPWHNSTYTLMRLFGILTLMLYVRIKNKYLESGIKPGEWTAFMLSLTLTNAAKPNFFIAFAPAMLIALIIDFIKHRGQGFRRMVLFGSAVLCSMPVLLFQKGSLFPSAAADSGNTAVYGIEITTRIVEKMWNNGIFLPLLVTGLTFYLMVTIVCIRKKETREYLGFAWLMLVIAVLTSWFVAETGPRANAGNLGWGVPFCAFSLMVICVERLMALRPKLKQSAFLLMLSPLVMMIMSGICYYVHLLGGGDFIA